jgi:hypothetical protein
MNTQFTVTNGNTWKNQDYEIRFEHNPDHSPITIIFNNGIPDLESQGKIVEAITNRIEYKREGNY